MSEESIQKAMKHFEQLLREQLERVEKLKSEPDWTDFGTIEPIIIGACGGDGIGPEITKHAVNVLEACGKCA
jgi:isocitrate dehydrogenase (NAD+)